MKGGGGFIPALFEISGRCQKNFPGEHVVGKNPIFTLKYLKIAPKIFSGELFGGAKFENLIMKGGGGFIPALLVILQNLKIS